jgi:mitosis inhibitor protein kinase SWE1
MARGKENRKSDIIGAAERRSLEKQIQEKSMAFNYEITAPINQALARLEGNDGGAPITSTSSPLKRSDAIMNLDQASLGSPVAKRRSLHGSASFGHDFNVFDHGPTSSPHFDIHDDTRPEFDSATAFTAGNSSPNFAALPRRSSSLRKSTLQQRHGDKTSWGRRHAYELSSLSNEYSTPVASKNRPRLSLDQFMPPLQRDSPFTSQGSLPNASMHILNPGQPKQHPLSRTLTTSSSSSSIVDESPTHVPVHFGENARPKLDFSKSLPAGALRPLAFDTIQREEFGSQTFSTPENYKSVKPLPAAFMSTGLISKVNHHPEDPPIIRGMSKSNMPDTPCKKPINGFATMPAPVAGSAIAKARHIRHSFGTPSTPFNPHGNRQTSGGFGANGGVFGSSFKSSAGNRRGSFLSDNGDETGGSPDMKADSQYSTENELPPTPTKQALFHGMPDSAGNGSPQSLRTLPPSAHGLSNKNTRKNSKLSVLTTSYDQDEDESDEAEGLNDSPTVAVFRLSQNSSSSMPSFSRSRALKGSNLEFPPPLAAKSLTSFLSPMRKPGFAKTSHVVPASPLDRIDFIERLSPCTPQEGMLPPDNSRLSSTRRTRQFHRQNSSTGSAMPPPATPTTARESVNKDGGITPVNGAVPAEVDEDLSSKFEKVELIGAGEFSVVYRVTQPIPQTQSFFRVNDSPLGRSPSLPLPQYVFAVKKARQPYQGIRDRNRKLQEVNVLKALGQSDHVVHLIDSWEQKDYLYIETEYCEEGSLDKFLSQVGRKGRLDDFRIWKIMLELGQVHVST